MKKISILTLTYSNRVDALRKCIESVNYHTHIPHQHIIVNNDSPQIKEFLENSRKEYPNLLTIDLLTNVGVSGRNYGIEIAEGEYILQLDDDAQIVHPEWLEVMLEYLSEDTFAVGSDASMFGGGWNKWDGEGGIFGSRDIKIGGYCDWLTGWCFLFRNTGKYFYDTNYKSLRDESDFLLQTKCAGWRFRKCPQVGIHNSQRNPNPNFDNYEKDTNYFIKKWSGKDIKWEGIK